MKDINHHSRVDPPAPDFVIAAQIRALSSTGFSKQGCAHHFRVSLGTFNRWLEENTELAEAFLQGRESERQALHNMLYKKAIEKQDSVAAMFLLKARHGYREGDQQEQANRVSITFNLPGAMSAEQYRTIEAVAVQKPKREGGDAID